MSTSAKPRSTKTPRKSTVARPKAAKPAAPAKSAAPKAAKPRMSLDEVMREMEKAGTEQARKTYRRHGITSPTFGTSFATLKVLMKRIGVDHELGVALWKTGNFDAQNLAVKIIDPARLTPAELDAWVRGAAASKWLGYVPGIAGETGMGAAKLSEWLGSKDLRDRLAGWNLLADRAQRDGTMADSVFEKRLAEIERTIHAAPNDERYAMNGAVIAIGCRNAPLRKAALAAAKRIGFVDVDHGDTSCKTPDAAGSIEKAWAHAKSKGFSSPAEQERAREVPRLRC
jgi:hypothetical protein